MFYFGVDYYPEHWPEERWSIDVQLMSEAGMNVVRLAEFAWSKMEPKDSQFEFGWLERAIETLSARGLQVVLGTPTASPPPWLMHKHPEIFRVREDGLRVTFGNRREYCPNNPIYHNYCQRIVQQMAEHFNNHPAVIGWQIDNEFGERCFCPVCAETFHTWLKKSYASLDKLNQSWGTVFWSHIYNDWVEIPLPLATGGTPNPGLALDFRRFSSDSYVRFQQKQIDILRRICPHHWITHNLMGFGYDQINYFDLAQNLDMISLDSYPRMQWNMAAEVDPSRLALSQDTVRSLKQKNFWMMEQQAGPGGWEMLSVMPRPGELRRWAYQAIAHGADGIVFFRWRTSRYGAEQFWHGLLDHDGTPSRRYDEIQRMGRELQRIGADVAGSQVRSRVAFLNSYDSRFAFQVQPNNPQFSYLDHFQALYRALYRHNLSIDVIAPCGDLTPYSLLIAPGLHLLDEQIASNLRGFVQQGGVLLLTQRTGVKDEHNIVVEKRLPGVLADVVGAEVEEYDSLAVGMSNRLEFLLPELGSAGSVEVGVLCDILKPTTAQTAARYTQEYYAGKAAITFNRYGQGAAIYVGAMGNDQLYDPLARWLLQLASLTDGLSTPPGVEAAVRWRGERKLIFLLNHSGETQIVHLQCQLTNLFDGTSVPVGDVSLPAHEALVLVG